MQLLCCVEEIESKFVAGASDIIRSLNKHDSIPDDFLVQLCKIFAGLTSDRYVKQREDTNARYEQFIRTLNDAQKAEEFVDWVCPRMFKQVAGKGHIAFSSNRQQDCEEYFGYLIDKINKYEEGELYRNAPNVYDLTNGTITSLFTFDIEKRLQCLQSNKVRYSTETVRVLSLHIPIDKNQLESVQKDGEEVARSKIAFSECIKDWADDASVEDYRSPETGEIGTASTRNRLTNFPPYLMVHMRRFYAAPDWTPAKLDCLVLAPESLDLEHLRGNGIKEGEEEMKDDKNCTKQKEEGGGGFEPNEEILNSLMGMGFGKNASTKACLALNNNNLDSCLEWLFRHMEDADFNDPLILDTPASPPSSMQMPGPSDLQPLRDMGFGEKQATIAYIQSNGNIENAIELCFGDISTWDDNTLKNILENLKQERQGGGGLNEIPQKKRHSVFRPDDKGVYHLLGFVTHMGNNANCGHYVCHIKKEGRWVIINDCKVAVSQEPPLDLGYMYLYKRKDWKSSHNVHLK